MKWNLADSEMPNHVYSFLFNYQIIVTVNILIYDFIAIQMINARVTDKSRCPLSNHTINFLNNNNNNKLKNILKTTDKMDNFMNDVNLTNHNNDINIDKYNNSKLPLLSRAKRYLAFPEGSSFTVSVCFTVGIIGNPRNDYMSFGLNWGVAYDLPNTSWILNHLHGFPESPNNLRNEVHHRRSRRALYQQVEMVIDNLGYDGRECILRALCESRKYLAPSKMSMIGEMLRIIFSLPQHRVSRRELHENAEIEIYDRAYRAAPHIENCAQAFQCSFSLLELASGKYSTPPPQYYSNHVPFM